MATSSKPRGRAPATGRFVTRAELCAWVWRQYLGTLASAPDIAAQARTSAAVVNKILNTNEGRPEAHAALTTTTGAPPP